MCIIGVYIVANVHTSDTFRHPLEGGPGLAPENVAFWCMQFNVDFGQNRRFPGFEVLVIFDIFIKF